MAKKNFQDRQPTRGRQGRTRDSNRYALEDRSCKENHKKQKMKKYILDDKGKPMIMKDLMLWDRWMKKADVIVSRDKINSHFIVETKFTGVAHGYDYEEEEYEEVERQDGMIVIDSHVGLHNYQRQMLSGMYSIGYGNRVLKPRLWKTTIKALNKIAKRKIHLYNLDRACKPKTKRKDAEANHKVLLNAAFIVSKEIDDRKRIDHLLKTPLKVIRKIIL